MARKRLNKKVAFIGSAILAVLVVIVIYAILHFSQDAGKFLKYGQAALRSARQAQDEEERTQEYERAERNYRQAHRFAKTDNEKIDVLFKLADLYMDIDEWRKVMGCWTQIIQLDQKNIEARFARLKYMHTMAETGIRQAWQEIESQASELLEVAQDARVLAEDTARWDPFNKQDDSDARQRMGPYLYLLKGRAILERTERGVYPDPDQSLTQAVDFFEKVRELEPENTDAAWYLAQAVVARGDVAASHGRFEQRDKAGKDAIELLQQLADIAPDNPIAHINLLSMKLRVAERSGAGLTYEQVDAFEPEYVSLAERFPGAPKAHAALARFYALNLKNLDKAINAIEKAVELDSENVTYAIDLATMLYRRYSALSQQDAVYQAIETARNALALPNAQNKPGPRYWANQRNRISLYIFLADCYIDQAIEIADSNEEAERRQWLTKGEQAVYEIEQLFQSGDAPEVIKWQGMLELARGNTDAAVKKLYAVYEQLKSGNLKDPLLSYRLAKLFENTSELGAAKEFFISALRWPNKFDGRKPEALLDYIDLLLKLREYGSALDVAAFFEGKYGPSERSWRLRMNALIGLGQFDEVQKELALRDAGQPDAIKLKIILLQAEIGRMQAALARKQVRDSSPLIFQDVEVLADEKPVEGTVEFMKAELKRYQTEWVGLVLKLLPLEPNSVPEASIITVCNSYYIAQGKIEQAKALVDEYLGYFPQSTPLLFYKALLLEPEPGSVTEQRRRQIEEQVLSSIADPVRRGVNLGRYYYGYNELEKAAAEFRKLLVAQVSPDGPAKQETPQEDSAVARRVAASYLLEIALTDKDWELAGQIAEQARRQDLDDCGGHFFAARLAVARQQHEKALAELEECLKYRPLFSHALWLRSNVNAALGNEHVSIEDARQATSLNPLDNKIARTLALLLYQRNRRLGAGVSAEQTIESRTALRRAMNLNPRDSQLRSVYAESVSDDNPDEALAIRQSLLEINPTVENAILLGQMALTAGLEEPDAERRKALLDIAASSFDRARTLDPEDPAALQAQAEYYRLTDQKEKAEQLLKQSQQPDLLWTHYVRSGNLEKARKVLEQLYQSRPEDTGVVKGLLLVAERAGDSNAVQKYSEELLAVEDNADNRLLQIQAFLKTGLVKEADLKLESFKELHQQDNRSLLLQAWLAMNKGQLENALELTNQSLAISRENALAWRIRGQIHFLMAEYAKAVDDFKTSKSFAPEPVARIALAKAYLRNGQVEDAIVELENTIDDPQAPLQAWLLLEHIYSRSARKTAIKRFYDRTLASFPGSALWCRRAAVFALSEGDFSSAEQLYLQAWEKTKTYTTEGAAALDGYLKALVLAAGSPLARTGWRPEKLDTLFAAAAPHVDNDFAPIAYYRMAEAKIKLADRDAATEYARKALAKAFAGKDERMSSEILARTCLLLGDGEVAKYAEQWTKDQPDSLPANFMAASLAVKNNRYNEALTYIDKCVRVAGPDSEIGRGYAVKRATVLQLNYKRTSDNNYLQKAVAEYESLLKKMPNNTVVLNNLAYILADTDRRNDALEYAARACERMPNNPAFLDTYGYVLHKTGDNSKAAEFLQASVQQYELNRASVPAEVHWHLGMAKEALGAKDEAIAAYQQALETGPNELSSEAREEIGKAVERLSQ
ncbi:MAG: tetratricopeptide repeat protein [Planctomycetota bacterium]|jgi:tetratricopeptide (TPR) repeat protein